LSEAALLTASHEDPSLAHELRRELESADQVDLICAFIKWRGLRLLESALQDLAERGAQLRVITTTYMGATERHAIDELANRYNAEVRINYETNSTRLHAKAWLFRRNSGFHTAYVGSSNLSQQALLDGLEWNVRLSGVATPRLVQKFQITFDSYWEKPNFVRYDAATDSDRLDAALRRAGGSTVSRDFGPTGLEVIPFLHQQEMLEDIEAARTKGFHENLVVAATGTGKTVVASLDYKKLGRDSGRLPSLLFVAHRREILEQSLRTYRHVLNNGSFGELLVGTEEPADWRHVFASVQSLNADRLEKIDPARFEVVVVDEFHHADAPTYRRLLNHLKPKELIGLTATPERSDGKSVADEFFGGRIASELRLWDALGEDLLVPFHYFGVADETDLRNLEWRRGNYDTAQLSALYTGNEARAAKVVAELRDKVLDTSHMRAIGFCVSVQHAEYMAMVFNQAGIPSAAVSGSSPQPEREAALHRLRDRSINCLFAVDLFNEGLDIPEIDTVLLLRPTQSSTVFLQQLGRGLRRAEGKAVLTVLDFIGQQHRQFRFDLKYRALLGIGRKQLEREIEDEFPSLPSGCQLVLDRVAQRTVLDGVRAQLRLPRRTVVEDVRSCRTRDLAEYLERSGNELRDVYRGTSDSWTGYLRAAGLISPDSVFEQIAAAVVARRAEDEEKELLKRVGRFLHVDDAERGGVYKALLSPDAPPYNELGLREKSFARMVFFTLELQRRFGYGDEAYDGGLNYLRSFPWVCREIAQVVSIGVAEARHTPRSLAASGQDALTLARVPLYTHATYNRYEVLAALGVDGGRIGSHREGVAWCEDAGADVFFVTLDKDEAQHSPTTMYRDYAISPELFHWESQSTTTLASPAGRRYISGDSQVLLFTRPAAKDDWGGAVPYTCLGAADYVQHSGERPIAITWRLRRPMPADVFAVANAIAG
jgi:superfamily II DNA or RNA helicase/HKD family nuclease